jgi:UDP-N-acetylmuramate dehydrogenase
MRFETAYSLANHNTFGLPSQAEYAVRLETDDDVAQFCAFAADRQLDRFILGGGSNVVLRPFVAGAVGLMMSKGRAISGSGEHSVFVTAKAGEDWSDFVSWTISSGVSGLENLAGIPGTVGAAPLQNIGAYGMEMADRFHSLTAWDCIDRCKVSLTREQCHFTYRNSMLKESGRYIVLDVTFALPRRWQPVLTYQGLKDEPALTDAAAVMERVLFLRAGKLPDWRLLGNAGSFFHNPVVPLEVANKIDGAPRYLQPDGQVKLSAGWLIDACGLKGMRIGGASVYDSHALVLVNRGLASYDDVAAVAAAVTDRVARRFGVTLVQEPRIV